MNDKQLCDQILARARGEVAMRRTAERERRWGGRWLWVLPVLTFSVVLAFLAAPLPLPRKLLLAMGGVCGIRPAHSYFAGDIQLPLEARMVGIYGGFMVTLIILVALGRLGARRLASRPTTLLLIGFFASMAIDGVNSTLADLGLPHPYTSTNVTRLITGLLAGLAIAPFLVWLLGVVTTPSRVENMRRPVFRAPWEVLLPLGANAGFAAMVMREQAIFYYPIAFISVGGVVLALALVTLLVVLGMSEPDGRISSARQLVAPSALSLLIAFAVLGLSAAIRWSVTGS